MKTLCKILVVVLAFSMPVSAWATDAKISALTAKTVPVGADSVAIVNSADATKSYKTTLAQIAANITVASVTGFSPATGKVLTLSKTMTLTCADDTAVATLPAGSTALLYSGGALGTPASGTLTNCTGSPLLSPVHGTITTASTIYPSTDGTNTGTKVNFFTVTALGAATVFALPPGSWNDGDKLTVRILDNGTATALDFTTNSTVWRAGSTIALPTTTVLGKTLYTAWLYNSASSTFDLVGLSGGF